MSGKSALINNKSVQINEQIEQGRYVMESLKNRYGLSHPLVLAQSGYLDKHILKWYKENSRIIGESGEMNGVE